MTVVSYFLIFYLVILYLCIICFFCNVRKCTCWKIKKNSNFYIYIFLYIYYYLIEKKDVLFLERERVFLLNLKYFYFSNFQILFQFQKCNKLFFSFHFFEQIHETPTRGVSTNLAFQRHTCKLNFTYQSRVHPFVDNFEFTSQLSRSYTLIRRVEIAELVFHLISVPLFVI